MNKNDVISYNWLSLDNCIINDNINTIFCDTRDYHCHSLEEKVNDKPFINFLDDLNYQIKQTDIISWLQLLKNIALQYNCRILQFKDFGFWRLKYIRFYRNPNNPEYFFVCDRDNNPIQWQLCIEQNLIQ